VFFKPDVIVGFEFEREYVIVVDGLSDPANAFFLVSGNLLGEAALDVVFS
jgi:hypothetical protein